MTLLLLWNGRTVTKGSGGRRGGLLTKTVIGKTLLTMSVRRTMKTIPTMTMIILKKMKKENKLRFTTLRKINAVSFVDAFSNRINMVCEIKFTALKKIDFTFNPVIISSEMADEIIKVAKLTSFVEGLNLKS